MRWVTLALLLLASVVAVSVLAIPPPPPANPSLPTLCEESNGGVEICDDIDNDCDQLTDEDVSGNPLRLSTTCGVGVCEGNTGYETCINGDYAGDTCDPFFGAHLVGGVPTEVCNYDFDYDCDGDTGVADDDCTLITCYQCSGPGTFRTTTVFNACASGWTSTVLTSSSCNVDVTCYQCDGGSVATQTFTNTCGTGWSTTIPTSCPVTCYQCNAGQIASATYSNSCPTGWSTTQPTSCPVTCYRCDTSTGTVQSQVFTTGGCGVGWALTQPASCEVPLVTCYQCDAGGDGIVLTELRESCAAPWTATVLTQADCTFDTPITCYQCSGPGQATSEEQQNACEPGWQEEALTDRDCDVSVTCYQCDSGQVSTGTYTNTCPADWSRTRPSSCPVTCYRCDTSTGTVQSQVFTTGGCGVGWALTQPASCEVPLVTCYQCQSGGTGVVLTDLRVSCTAPWTSTVLTQADCTLDSPVTCYQCDSGQIASGEFLNECPSGWNLTRPASCSVTCYRCNTTTGTVDSRSFVGGCGTGWALTRPASCTVPLVTCYRCQSGGTGVVLSSLNQSCAAPWTATQLTYADCRVDVTCYQCIEGQVASNNFTNACPTGWAATEPSSCPVTCYQCDGDTMQSQEFTSGCGTGWVLTAPASCEASLVTCYRCQDGSNGVVLTELVAECRSGWSTSSLASSDCRRSKKTSSSSSSSWNWPTSDDDDDDDEEEEDIPPLRHLLQWVYKDSVASATVTDPMSPVKRLSGNVPEGPFLRNSSMVVPDPDDLPAQFPKDFSVYRRFKFEGDVDGVVFEELKVTFTIDAAWLTEQNVSPDDIVVLHPFDGRWRISAAEYSESSRLYKASLINVPLQSFSLGVGDLVPADEADKEVSVQTEPLTPPPANGSAVEPEQERPARQRHPVLWSVLVAVLIGGLLVAFFLVPDVPVLVGFHDAVREKVGEMSEAVHDKIGGHRPQQPSLASTQPLQQQPVREWPVRQPGAAQTAAQIADEQKRRYDALVVRLDSYVAKQRLRGVPEEQIVAALRRAGWQDDLLRRHFRF